METEGIANDFAVSGDAKLAEGVGRVGIPYLHR